MHGPPKTEKPTVCDFCSTPVPDDKEHLIFTREPIVWIDDASVKHVDSVEWLACDICRGFLDTGDKDGLTKRTFDSFMELNPTANRVLTQQNLRMYHEIFWNLYLPMGKEESDAH